MDKLEQQIPLKLLEKDTVACLCSPNDSYKKKEQNKERQNEKKKAQVRWAASLSPSSAIFLLKS